ncbi:MAG TPA: MauE/DoxX family redox-associated membrane protein, partial [Conexibacter sp.]|nr:MauE/DoxX family redox-associated membrane protein [Conexibacter sp.]
MLASVANALLALVLLVSAGAKLARPAAAQAALATHGLVTPRARTLAWAAAIVVEGALAVAVALGSALAAYAAAALMAVFALLLVRALRAGRAGAACGCLGARGRVGAPAVARAALLAVAFAALPSVPDVDPAATGWLALGLAAALAGLAALALLVLALAREVGELRAAVGPQPALEIPGEGPPLGVPVELIGRFELRERTR